MHMQAMVIQVVKFSSGGYKVRKVFAQTSIHPKENDWIFRIGVIGKCQKVSKFDFQRQFAKSKIIEIFLNLGAHFLSLTFFDNMNF